MDIISRGVYANRILEGLGGTEYVTVNRALIKKANNIAREYSGLIHPKMIRYMYDDLEKLGITVDLITGTPDKSSSGTKSWTVKWYYNDKEVENSRFVYQMYEPQNSDKVEFNIYFS